MKFLSQEIPVKLRCRSGGLYILSIPKKFSDTTIARGRLMEEGHSYLMEIKGQLYNNGKVIERKRAKTIKGVPIHINMDRDFAKSVIDEQYPELENYEMEREQKIDDLAEALELIILRYDFITGKLTLEDNEDLQY